MEWIKVSERLPEAHTNVLAICAPPKYPRFTLTQVASYSNKAYWYDMTGEIVAVTHWMPLPEPPEEPKP